jgi:hypothetical protein
MKTIVIAGASSAIAAGTVAALQSIEPELSLVAYSRREPAFEGVSPRWISWDVTEEFPGLPGGLERIDALMYCPGTISLKPFKGMSVDQFEQDMRVNLFGALPLLKAALPLMTGGSDVLFFSSVAAGTGMAYTVPSPRRRPLWRVSSVPWPQNTPRRTSGSTRFPSPSPTPRWLPGFFPPMTSAGIWLPVIPWADSVIRPKSEPWLPIFWPAAIPG